MGKKKSKIKKNIIRKYIERNIEEDYINYKTLEKEGIPSIIPIINDKGKKVLFSYKRKSGPNYEYRCKDRN